MSGETNLSQLLKTMEPELDEKAYVFITQQDKVRLPVEGVIGSFVEKEGLTLIVEKTIAEANGSTHEVTWKRIIMTVHSSLEAVGFLAALSKQLADHGISVNAISAYYHDHLFVPEHRADEAMRLLKELAAQST